MATKKSPGRLATLKTNPSAQVTKFKETMESNPHVARYEIRVDKQTGVTHLSARYTDGRVATQVELSPGLQSIVKFDPQSCTKEERDAGILKLLDSGMTQAQAAASTGVSQTLVSQVSRRANSTET